MRPMYMATDDSNDRVELTRLDIDVQVERHGHLVTGVERTFVVEMPLSCECFAIPVQLKVAMERNYPVRVLVDGDVYVAGVDQVSMYPDKRARATVEWTLVSHEKLDNSDVFTLQIATEDGLIDMGDGDVMTKDAMRDAVERGSMDLQTSAEVAQNVIDGFSEPGCPDCEGHGRPGWIELATSWVRCDCNQESGAS